MGLEHVKLTVTDLDRSIADNTRGGDHVAVGVLRGDGDHKPAVEDPSTDGTIE